MRIKAGTAKFALDRDHPVCGKNVTATTNEFNSSQNCGLCTFPMTQVIKIILI